MTCGLGGLGLAVMHFSLLSKYSHALRVHWLRHYHHQVPVALVVKNVMKDEDINTNKRTSPPAKSNWPLEAEAWLWNHSCDCVRYCLSSPNTHARLSRPPHNSWRSGVLSTAEVTGLRKASTVRLTQPGTAHQHLFRVQRRGKKYDREFNPDWNHFLIGCKIMAILIFMSVSGTAEPVTVIIGTHLRSIETVSDLDAQNTKLGFCPNFDLRNVCVNLTVITLNEGTRQSPVSTGRKFPV